MKQEDGLRFIKLPDFPPICLVKSHDMLGDFTFGSSPVIMFEQECQKEGPCSMYVETTILHRDSIENFSTVLEDESLYRVPNIVTLVDIDTRTERASVSYRGGLIAQFVDGSNWKKTTTLTLGQWDEMIRSEE
jgi:hypothetical protein